MFLALPAHPELLAKYYDLRELVKKTDLMIIQTHALGLVKKMTYQPSRLSGLWDMMNTVSENLNTSTYFTINVMQNSTHGYLFSTILIVH